MSLGRGLNKIRQAFNLLLLFALIAAVAGVFIFFLSTPESRNTTFWISIIALTVALVLAFLFSCKIIFSANDTPVSFAQIMLVALYALFVAALAIANVFAKFSVKSYLLIHVGGAAVFLIPLLLSNMLALKLNNAEHREQQAGRLNLANKALAIEGVFNKLIAADASLREKLAPVKRLAESLKFSDPTPASGKTERALGAALDELEAAAGDVNNLLAACAAADAALKQRNSEILNAKG